MNSQLAGIAAAALDLLLPALCPGCLMMTGPGICAACRGLLEPLDRPCPWCATPGQADAPRCRACDNRGLPGIARIHVAWHYRGLAETLVRKAKAAARPAAVRACTTLMPGIAAPAFDLVVPLPATPGRRPGPHLATALARALARRHHLPLRRLLRLTRTAVEQHRLGQGERRHNVTGLFQAAPCQGRVLLVDDLLTSGATATAAARALREAGATRIELAVLARTPRRDDS